MEEAIGRAIIRTANLVRRRVDRTVAGVEGATTGGHARILGYLAAHEGQDVYQKDIEHSFSLAKSTVSTLLTQLEREGLLHREGVDQDARLRRIVLTDKARALNCQVYTRLSALEAELAQNFTPEELACFLGYLDRVALTLSPKKGGH